MDGSWSIRHVPAGLRDLLEAHVPVGARHPAVLARVDRVQGARALEGHVRVTPEDQDRVQEVRAQESLVQEVRAQESLAREVRALEVRILGVRVVMIEWAIAVMVVRMSGQAIVPVVAPMIDRDFVVVLEAEDAEPTAVTSAVMIAAMIGAVTGVAIGVEDPRVKAPGAYLLVELERKSANRRTRPSVAEQLCGLAVQAKREKTSSRRGSTEHLRSGSTRGRCATPQCRRQFEAEKQRRLRGVGTRNVPENSPLRWRPRSTMFSSLAEQHV